MKPYRRKLSREDAETGTILITKDRWPAFPPPMQEFSISIGAADAVRDAHRRRRLRLRAAAAPALPPRSRSLLQAARLLARGASSRSRSATATTPSAMDRDEEEGLRAFALIVGAYAGAGYPERPQWIERDGVRSDVVAVESRRGARRSGSGFACACRTARRSYCIMCRSWTCGPASGRIAGRTASSAGG